MLQLIYASRASDCWNGDLNALSDECKPSNARDEITGILLLHEGFFLQVLEGPKVLVEDAFIRIVSDPRHYALLLLSRKELSRRQFGDWAMMAINDVEQKDEALRAISDVVDGSDPVARDRLAAILHRSQSSA